MAHRCASQSACMAHRCESQGACMAHRCELQGAYHSTQTTHTEGHWALVGGARHSVIMQPQTGLRPPEHVH